MKNNKKIKNIIGICFAIISIALFTFLFVLNYKSGTNELLFKSNGDLNISATMIVFSHAIFITLIPLVLGGKIIKCLKEQALYIQTYVCFLSVNLMFNCLTYFLILIEGNDKYTLLFFDAIFLIDFLFYLGMKKRISIDMEEMQKEKEKQLLTMYKTASNIMLGQMKQHFLYNTLNTIKFLITEDAEKAETAIVKFSEFLRQNMNALSNGNFILFEQELRHIENYVYVEKLRFEDRLRVHYNIETKDFFVPSLSIQPLVENAIEHGITKKIDGGDVWIDVYRMEDSFVVEIRDNGVGFDTRILDTASPSVAIKNIKDRINIIDGASFVIESKVNEGTKCVITIPKDLPQNMDFFVKERGE